VNETPALALQRYLHERIPLSRAMAVEVLEATPDGVLLRAALAPNINHRDTVFGGSAAALAILSAWALLLLRLRAAGIEARLVIQRNTMEYERPMLAAFTARSFLAEATDWERFVQLLERRGRARIEVASVLECDGETAGRMHGEFVALAGHGN
jgi:thioesterase domain-containing protein